MIRRAFTLTEILIGIVIMLILAGVMTLSTSAVGRQTAKREADRVAAYLQDKMRRADMTRSVVWFTVTTNEIKIGTGASPTPATATLKASGKCTYSPLQLVYPKNEEQRLGIYSGGTFSPVVQDSSVSVGTGTGTYTLTVHGEDGNTRNIIIGR